MQDITIPLLFCSTFFFDQGCFICFICFILVSCWICRTCKHNICAARPSPNRVHLHNSVWLVLFRVRSNECVRERVWDKHVNYQRRRDKRERNSNIMEVLSLFQFCSALLSLAVWSLWWQTCVSSVHQALDTLCPLSLVCVRLCVCITHSATIS